MHPDLYQQFAEIERAHWWFVGRRAVVADVLVRHLSRHDAPLRILDVGCGTGAMVEVLQRYGDVTSMDASTEAIALCQERFPDADFLVGAVPDDLPTAPSSFHLVTAFDVLEHIEDDVAALDAIRDRLVPGGLVVCTVPAYQWMWGPHDDLNEHKRRYTRRRLWAAFEAAGFEEEQLSYFNTLLFPIVAAVRLARGVLRHRIEPRSDFVMPSPRVNRILAGVLGSERLWLRRRSLPFGVSLLAVARRPR